MKTFDIGSLRCRAWIGGARTLAAVVAVVALCAPALAQDAATPSPADMIAPADRAQPAAAGDGASADQSSKAAEPASSTSTSTGPRLAEPVASPEGLAEGARPAVPNAPSQPAKPSTLPHDLSPWGMFMAADWVVKGVMIGLAFASLVTWTVWVAKSLELAGSKAKLRGALRAILEARTLADAASSLDGRRGAGALLVQAAREETALSAEIIAHAGFDGVKERVSSRLSRIQAQAGRQLTRGTGVLATIGSTAPFVGLFGTVWGIMNSFIGISEAQTTNLAVVAPGIAEALLATAIGLVAAIPAVVIYNVFARSVAAYRAALADAAAGVERLVSRDLDYSLVRPVEHHTRHRHHVANDSIMRPAAAE